MGAWIRMLSDEQADEKLRQALRFARTPHGTVDNVMRVHSLRPSTMNGHVALYHAALHDESNELPGWFQETIASYVSILNECDYSLANHWANARHLMDDPEKAARIEDALKSRNPAAAFAGSELEMLRYAEKLTVSPAAMKKSDVEALLGSGVDDGCVLELNQIVCYFNYANRVLNGLGVTTDGDIVGYYASDSNSSNSDRASKRSSDGATVSDE